MQDARNIGGHIQDILATAAVVAISSATTTLALTQQCVSLKADYESFRRTRSRRIKSPEARVRGVDENRTQ